MSGKDPVDKYEALKDNAGPCDLKRLQAAYDCAKYYEEEKKDIQKANDVLKKALEQAMEAIENVVEEDF